jgi:hypothetical protein
MLTQSALQVILIHFYSSPLTTIFKLMQDAAPVFRRACPEPSEQLVNLPNLLQEPGLHRRYFAAIDVALSVTTNRPMLFRYDVTFATEFFHRMSPENLQTDYGVEWVHGIPDQFIILFALINGLREDFFGRSVDPECVARIENQVREVKFVPSISIGPDPTLRVGRLVVQECWRQAVYLYLYMVSCLSWLFG